MPQPRKSSKQATSSRIVRDPAIWGGEPTIYGTRVPVSSIVIEWQLSQDLKQVHQAFPRVDVPTIREALAYYETHREEIDRLIEENEQGAYSTD
jgi:uncharacterized protein (DUF433 family)